MLRAVFAVIILLASVISAFIAIGSVNQIKAAEISTIDDSIIIEGFFVPEDFDNFIEEIKKEEFNSVTKVILKDSLGGDFYTSVRIGLSIKILELDTQTEGLCYSACAYTWLSGNTRYYDPFSTIGIHMPAGVNDETDEDYAASSEIATLMVVWYLTKVDVPLPAIEIFVEVDNRKILYFNKTFLFMLNIEAEEITDY